MDYIYEDNLESERLITRKAKTDDYTVWSEFFDDEESMKFIPAFGVTEKTERAKHWIERQMKRDATKQFGLQFLIEKTTKQIVGMCGLLAQEVEGIKEVEIGYHLLKKHWGKGYASEAANLFKQYAFTNNISPSIISIIHVENIRSQKVAVNNGMACEKQCNWNDLDVFIYRVRNK